MEENYKKYAELLLKKGLCIKKGQPLLISTPIESFEFTRVLTTVALELGVKDIYYDYNDSYIKHDHLKYLDIDSISKNTLFNKNIYNEYAKKGAAILMLVGSNPDIMSDIDDNNLKESINVLINSRKYYKKMQLNNKVSWCIAAVSTLDHAKKVFPNSKNPTLDLWNTIFKMCLIDKPNPIKEWENKNALNAKRIDKLNKLNIKKLIYKNKLGTNLEIGLTNNIWRGANSLINGQYLIVNIPSEEIFTAPDKTKINGIVYSSKPLIYNGSIIDEFWIKFKDGIVIDYDAKKGKNVLKSIIDIKGGNSLGEVALVDKNSPISKSNILFYETLYDENASCHLALGEGFLECSKDKKPKWLNKSDTHVDFMIGTDDLNIEAITNNGNVTIMKNGKFTI